MTLTGADRIAVERARQKLSPDAGGEGYDAEHDQDHADELAMAGALYATPPADRAHVAGDAVPYGWPWATRFWKPTADGSIDGRIRELEKAGALIAASIDALEASR